MDLELAEKNEALEKNLREKEAVKNYLDDILQSLTNGVIAVDQDGTVTTFNKTASTITGLNHQACMGKPWRDVLTQELFQNLVGRAMEDTEPITFDGDLETADGRRLRVRVSTSPAVDNQAGRIGTILVLQDITRLKRLEDESHRNDRLRAMGEMAAGIAHEIRNPMGGIELFASLLKKDVADDPEKARLAEHIVSGIRNMDRTISSLLLFAKSPEPSRTRCDINQLLKQLVEVKHHLNVPDDIEVLWQLCPQESMGEGDGDLLQQVFLNFMRNAIQAMPEGGTLTVHTEVGDSPNAGGLHRKAIVVSIKDTGIGISEEDRKHIFNPFFSTKEKGTGLGLAIAHNIIKAHQGTIDVESTPGNGTEFIIRLPAWEETNMADASSFSVLIVDDEDEMRAALSETLKREGYQIATAENGKEALNLCEQKSFDLLVSDVNMPKLTGPELLKAVRECSPTTRVIMITAYGTIDNAVETMKLGASDYLLKPFSAEVLVATVTRALRGEAEPAPQKTASEPRLSVPDERKIVTSNPKMQELIGFVENVAYSKSTVLISGETGTGKEMFARYIHLCSPRADKPFMAVNCAALPEGLLESELFGHEKGAFTGAVARKDGKFELAHRGTLLLDEVTEMEMPLRQNCCAFFRNMKSTKSVDANQSRWMCASSPPPTRTLKKLIAENKFREDLYYRLNVIPLKLPPLRERIEDIPLLAEHFIRKHGKINERNVTGIADETRALLQKYGWSGNVRELENVIERAVLLCTGETLQPGNLFLDEDASPSAGSAAQKLSGTIYDMERELIFQTLDEVGGNKTQAAEKLGISIRTLRNKLNEYQDQGHSRG